MCLCVYLSHYLLACMFDSSWHFPLGCECLIDKGCDAGVLLSLCQRLIPFLRSCSHVPCQRQPSGTKRLPNIPLIFIGQQGQRGWLSGADVPLNPKSCPTVRDCEGKCEVSLKPCRLDVRINKFRADSVGFVKVGAPSPSPPRPLLLEIWRIVQTIPYENIPVYIAECYEINHMCLHPPLPYYGEVLSDIANETSTARQRD